MVPAAVGPSESLADNPSETGPAVPYGGGVEAGGASTGGSTAPDLA